MAALFKFKRLLLHKHINGCRYIIRTLHHTSPTATNPRNLHLLLNGADCGARLDAYTKARSLQNGKQLHAYMLYSGLLNSTTHHHLRSKLAAMYVICGATDHARRIFDEIPKITISTFLWNTMIRGYAQNGRSEDAVFMFDEMLSSGRQRPDNFSFPFVLKACADLSLLKLGMEIHCQAVVGGFGGDAYVQNSLIAMYMSCGEIEMARVVFEKMPERTVVSWNTMIAGSFKNGFSEEALGLFDQMRDAGVEADCATVVCLLPVCAHLKDLARGRRVHDLVDEMGFGSHLAVRNSLVDMYAKCGSLVDARRVFDEACEKDVVSWTAMIGGYVLNGFVHEALILSHLMMQLSVIRPNSVTLAGLLSACAGSSSLKHGKCIHGSAIRHGLQSDVVVETAVIDMYMKCGCVDLGYRVFAKASRRTAPWNAILSGYNRNGLAREAIMHFKLMQMEEVYPDAATMTSLLPSYANLADLQQAMNIHGYLIRSGFHERVDISTALIDVYSKSGSLDYAINLFERLPNKDIVSWSAIISGCGMHGHGRAAILLFNEMMQSGVEPNQITFTSMLYACSHAGLVDAGLHFFNSMVGNHHMKPRLDHYACIVDLLGRAGRLGEAHELIKTMPFEPNHAVWGALLGACVIHKDAALGEVAAKHLFELEPENTGNYVLLANLYASMERWEDVEAVRNMMSKRGLKKTPGYSSIEVRNTVQDVLPRFLDVGAFS
ncbi:pentatricopeptide repeat-containing protein At5g39350 [Magnolia sinica]|uniref:pentatricopeptide repeat-containing protein At5g39350 n=1 Tax=Magnolia sinica TaxID=86752 RepID=UPI0026593475|nr:pentatricopeptide repeat-containing protein At5g39350 [Magnolia sinica]